MYLVQVTIIPAWEFTIATHLPFLLQYVLKIAARMILINPSQIMSLICSKTSNSLYYPVLLSCPPPHSLCPATLASQTTQGSVLLWPGMCFPQISAGVASSPPSGLFIFSAGSSLLSPLKLQLLPHSYIPSFHNAYRHLTYNMFIFFFCSFSASPPERKHHEGKGFVCFVNCCILNAWLIASVQ